MQCRPRSPLKIRLAIWIAALVMGQPVAAQTSPLPAVRTYVVASPSETVTRQFFGQVRARETVDLSFDVGGTMTLLAPEEGERVARGDVLAQLDLDPYERAVERAALSLEMATREALRAATLAERQVGAATRAEDAATARDMADVALRDARAALADATLRAPFDGLVAVRLTPAFSAVSPGLPVVRVHDLSEVRVEIALPEQLFQQIGALEQIGFTADLPGGPDAALRLVAFQPDTDRVGQSYRVTLAFEDAVDVLPGASVTVRATIPAPPQGVQIPASALLAGNARDASVLALVPQDEAFVLRRQPVTVIAGAGSRFSVEGLPAGTEIVAAGAHLLREGQTVRRFTGLTTSED
ncbi:efflux RND transporter periplasmic adaptor subunit [Rhodosalinus sediminis]|jgi:RND family efflux transporter MFP subunit|uniref:Efflux RND transporter periplasmic adaptor subunit n=2 Tax=Rhodosalinus sediminis TaxID=1940533 RepID=A0A3D9BKV2_9RHOB|nr:efflux RND transporter periplasmic adaptor subunit [Rhodosalinus sediminis]